VEFKQLQIRKNMPKVMYILGYGLDDLWFKSHQGQETPLSSKLKGKKQTSNPTKKTSLPISKTQSTALNKHNTYGRMGNTLQLNTPKLSTDFPTHQSPAENILKKKSQCRKRLHHKGRKKQRGEGRSDRIFYEHTRDAENCY
jgi:hypothetical protein